MASKKVPAPPGLVPPSKAPPKYPPGGPAGTTPPKKGGAVTFPKPPPPPSKKAPGPKYQQFINYWAAHGYKALKKNAQAIERAAKAEHIDPITFAALLLNESGAKFNVNKSSAGALGIGQLLPSTFIGPHGWNGGVLPWAPKHKITLADLQDKGINVRLAAAYFGYLQGQYPTDPYGRYNAGPNAPDAVTGKIQQSFTAKWITPWDPSYVPPAGTTAPPGPAGPQVPGGTGLPTPDNPVFKDPYVTGIKHGKDGKFALTDDPNKAMQFDGRPLTRSGFLSLKDQLTSIYVSYTGGRPTNAQIQQFIIKGWDAQYTLPSILSQGAKFDKSPIYKQVVTNWMNDPTIKDALGGGKLPPDLLRQGVLNHWDATTILTKIRALPQYIRSNEFKGTVATFLNIHTSIMGTPDKKAMLAIQDAALQGWKPDQYAAWLRAQPEYTGSPEYQTKALTMLQGLGLITGQNPILAHGVGPGPGAVQPGTQTLKPDPRIKGNPNDQNPTAVSDLGATLGRA